MPEEPIYIGTHHTATDSDPGYFVDGSGRIALTSRCEEGHDIHFDSERALSGSPIACPRGCPVRHIDGSSLVDLDWCDRSIQDLHNEAAGLTDTHYLPGGSHA